jgi:hypothetical protein
MRVLSNNSRNVKKIWDYVRNSIYYTGDDNIIIEDVFVGMVRATAPFTLSKDVYLYNENNEEISFGTFSIFFNPQYVDIWGGYFRCVGLIKAPIPFKYVNDSLLSDSVVAWFYEDFANLKSSKLSGTSTVCKNIKFSDQETSAHIETRISWSIELTESILHNILSGENTVQKMAPHLASTKSLFFKHFNAFCRYIKRHGNIK